MAHRSSRIEYDANTLSNSPHWRQRASKWTCLVCSDAQGKQWDLSHAIRHNDQQKHKDNARIAQTPTSIAAQLLAVPTFASDASRTPVDPGLETLRFLSERFRQCAAAGNEAHAALGSSDSDFCMSEDPCFDADFVDEGPTEQQERLSGQLAAHLRRMWADPDVDAILSDDDDNEAIAEGSDRDPEDDDPPPVLDSPGKADDPWFPYGNEHECSFNILKYLRRGALSRQQLELARWHAEFNGARHLPTERQMNRVDKLLQDACGIKTIPYMGAMGNRFSVNSLADMLAQEHANPRVRPHLRHLPEDTCGAPKSESWQFQQWMDRIPDDLTTPMVRLGETGNFQDYYIFEPALLHSRAPVLVCMPFRWFNRSGKLFAKAWKLVPVNRLAEDGSDRAGWHVLEYDTMDIPATDFVAAFPTFRNTHKSYGVPDPCCVLGSFLSPDARTPQDLRPWTRTKPDVGNRWRSLADGKRVRCVPFWLYCDDTSGNQSKKWNKHNSFLFSLAGLPRDQAQLEYNIHFLTTSNTAATTEMLDAVVDQISDCQESGIWAYDCEEKDVVLLIPFALALLGDNPMQSEFACHIGLRGRHFCRVCWVQGKVSGQEPEDGPTTEPGDASGNESTASTAAGGQTRRKKAEETMAAMLTRVQNFVKVGRLRNRAETERNIAKLEEAASLPVNAQKTYKELKTEYGTKDTFLEFFVDKLFRAIKGKRAGPARSTAADACTATFPPQISSPIWRLEALDPHRDTPVEVLHVVLLGVIKYFWRDVVNNQCKSPESRAELIARLNSFDTAGLGIPPLRGETLVQYAGSLVGRDFRAVVQAAPFVLHGIVDDRCFRTWTALAQLVPLIWQPEIDDLDQYLATLTSAINDVLASTAAWTPQWFNKPKFHILLHLPEHIRRFGPAILFATEGFESFNAVIRSKSLHSNRQAPSKDIAVAFAHGDRVRHLLSGGYFRWQASVPPHSRHTQAPNEIDLRRPKSARLRAYTPVKLDPSDFVCAGRGVVNLPLLNSIVASHLGLTPLLGSPKVARVVYEGTAVTQLAATATGKQTALSSLGLGAHASVRQCKLTDLANGDACTPGQWVLVTPRHRPRLGRVKEILEVQQHTSGSRRRRVVLINTCAPPSQSSAVYRMPKLPSPAEWIVVDSSDVLCTVNVQHDCASSQCAATASRPVFQERRETANTIPVIAHLPTDTWILNTGQMRDAFLVQKLNLRAAPLDLGAAVLDGVRADVDKRKRAAPPAANAAVMPRHRAPPDYATGTRPLAQQVPPSSAAASHPAYGIAGDVRQHPQSGNWIGHPAAVTMQPPLDAQRYWAPVPMQRLPEMTSTSIARPALQSTRAVSRYENFARQDYSTGAGGTSSTFSEPGNDPQWTEAFQTNNWSTGGSSNHRF